MFILITIIKSLLIALPLIIAVAYFTLVERKIMAGIQRRRGPDVVGAWGLIQPFADAAKLILKETILPSTANTVLFVIAPILSFMLSLVGWAVIPFGETFVLADINVGVLYLFAVSSLGVYGIIMSGWASNSKYAFLGGLRSAAQMVSYEVSIGFILIAVILCAGSLNLSTIVMSQQTVWYGLPLFPMFFMFFISALAETNRHQFDLPEAEAELVAGYNVEYSAAGFALFFLAEYSNIILMCTLTTILFMGGWYSLIDMYIFNLIPGVVWFSLKTLFFIILFIIVRGTLPRYRYDQLMRLGWKIFLPISLAFVLILASLMISFNFLVDIIK